jgi:hypothetical protein
VATHCVDGNLASAGVDGVCVERAGQRQARAGGGWCGVCCGYGQQRQTGSAISGLVQLREEGRGGKYS